MYTNRINHLKEMHSQLDKLVDRAERGYTIDAIELSKLKKKRLRCRDEISKLTLLDKNKEVTIKAVDDIIT